jgi:hypothetical protein
MSRRTWLAASSNLARHVYRYESQHPPLARAMAALGPYLDGARPVGEPNPEWEGDAILCHSGHPGRTLFLARLGVLPFFLLACLAVYFWARHHFGNLAYVAVERAGLNKLAAGARQRAAPFALAVIAGALLIWAGYWFSFGPVPAPEFFDGIRNAIHHNSTGHTAYLLGQVSKTGWWYSFPWPWR